MIEP